MKKIYLLTKTLLAVALLCVGQNAWGGVLSLYSQDYESATDASSWVTQNLAPTLETGDATYGKYIQMSVGNNNSRSTYTTWGKAFYGDYTTYTLEFDATLNFSTDNTRNQSTSFAIMADGYALPAANSTYNSDYIFKITSEANTTNFSINEEETVYVMPKDVWCHYTIVVDGDKGTATYTITNKSTSTQLATGTYNIPDGKSFKAVGMYYLSGRYGAVGKFDNISITTEVDSEIVTDPGVAVTAVDGANRTVTITGGTSTEGTATVTTYYTTDGNDPTSSSSVYSSPLTITEDCTVKAISISDKGGESGVSSLAVTTGEITLNAPSAYISAMTSSGSIYNPTYNATSDQTDKPLSPVATITATFKGASVSLPYTVTSSGTLAITVSAEGYTSATTNIVYDFVPSYDITKSADFTEINESNLETKLDDTWTIAGSSTRWSSWSTTGGVGKDGTPNGGGAYWPVSTSSSFPITVYDFVKLNTTGTQLLIGWGFGRNSTGNTNFTIADAESTAVAEYIVSNYGNSAYSVFRYNTDNLSYNVANGVVKGVKYYTTVVPASITSTTGYATFSSTSPVNVDVEGLEAYIATGKNGDYITMEKVTGDIAANIGLVLKGTTETTYNLPVKASGDTPSGNLLQPCDGSWTTLTKSDTGTNYVLSEQGDPKVAVFAPINKTNATLRAGVAYLYIEGGVVEARALRFSFGGITEIENVEAAAEATAKKNGAYLENGKIAIYKNGMKFNANGQLIK